VRDQQKKDRESLFLLYQGLDEAIFEKVIKTISSKQAWDTLGIFFANIDRVKQIWFQTIWVEFEAA
jgi:hypothetical protein